MTGTLITVVLWALPVALLLWVLLLLARSIARRRSGVEGVAPGMTVYGADDHMIGVVDAVAPNGLQVGGQFIAGNAVRRVVGNRVDLATPSLAFSRGVNRGDRTAGGVGPLASDDEATPIRVSTTPGPPNVRVYQDIGGDRGRRRDDARDAGAESPREQGRVPDAGGTPAGHPGGRRVPGRCLGLTRHS